MRLAETALDQLFRDARSHSGWQAHDVPDHLLHELYELFKWGPTSANSSPARIVFVKSATAKEHLVHCMISGNIEKTRSAPVVAVIGADYEFYEQLPRLYPAVDARSWFLGNQALIDATAFRNSSLQGAYLMLAARSLGLDCGPMSGFDAAKLNNAFFAGSTVKVNFVCALGYGDPAKLRPRGPRLAFEEACRIE
jgi:3-hydroxypropanoate dehydrogenase